MQLLGTGNRNLILNKITRKSPTLEKKAPSKALILFDGTTKTTGKEGVSIKNKKLSIQMEKTFALRKNFPNCHLHLEFLLPYRPGARGQGGEIVAYTTLTCMKIKFWILLDWNFLEQ